MRFHKSPPPCWCYTPQSLQLLGLGIACFLFLTIWNKCPGAQSHGRSIRWQQACLLKTPEPYVLVLAHRWRQHTSSGSASWSTSSGSSRSERSPSPVSCPGPSSSDRSMSGSSLPHTFLICLFTWNNWNITLTRFTNYEYHIAANCHTFTV